MKDLHHQILAKKKYNNNNRPQVAVEAVPPHVCAVMLMVIISSVAVLVVYVIPGIQREFTTFTENSYSKKNGGDDLRSKSIRSTMASFVEEKMVEVVNDKQQISLDVDETRRRKEVRRRSGEQGGREKDERAELAVLDSPERLRELTDRLLELSSKASRKSTENNVDDPEAELHDLFEVLSKESMLPLPMLQSMVKTLVERLPSPTQKEQGGEQRHADAATAFEAAVAAASRAKQQANGGSGTSSATQQALLRHNDEKTG